MSARAVMGHEDEYPHDDHEWEEYRLTRVESTDSGGWTIYHDSMGFYCPPGAAVPNVGSLARYYGRGFGFVVRGLFIDGRRAFYRTESEQRTHDLASLAASEAEQRATFERNRAEMDARVSALPAVFQERLDRFRTNNPDFRWKYESYELFVCEEAVKLIDSLKTADAVRQFSRWSWEEQIAALPGVSDQHSGNTWGMALRLAYEFLIRPDRVKAWHGAMAPLVGSAEYGCVEKGLDKA